LCAESECSLILYHSDTGRTTKNFGGGRLLQKHEVCISRYMEAKAFVASQKFQYRGSENHAANPGR